MAEYFLPLLSYDDPENETVTSSPGAGAEPMGAYQSENDKMIVMQLARSVYHGQSCSVEVSGEAPTAASHSPQPNVEASRPAQLSCNSKANICCVASASRTHVQDCGPATLDVPAATNASDVAFGSSSTHSSVTNPSTGRGTISKPISPGHGTSNSSSVSTATTAVAADEDAEEVPPLDSLDDFEARRRRAVFTAMLLLLDHGARDSEHLSHLVAPMSGEELQQVAEERALAGRCGNPLCSSVHPITQSQPPRRRWDPAMGFLEPPPPSHFCSAACELLVESYAAQLGDNPLERLAPGVGEMLAVSHAPRRPGLENVAAQGGGVATMLSEVRERDPKAAAVEAVAGGRELDRRAAEVAAAGGQGGGHDGGSSAVAVEGYIPRAGKLRKPAAAATAAPLAAAAAATSSSQVERPQFSAGGTPPDLKPSLRKPSVALKVTAVDKGGGNIEVGVNGTPRVIGPVAAAAAAATSGTGGREQKRVTFGPKIEYQMPADPSCRASSSTSPSTAPQDTPQSVLVFDVDDDADDTAQGRSAHGGAIYAGRRRQSSSRQGGGEGGSAGMRGTLRVAEATEAHGEVQAAEQGWGKGLTDEELAATMQEKVPPSAIPPAMKLWFPPSAGGRGVGRCREAGNSGRRKASQPPLASEPSPKQVTQAVSQCGPLHPDGATADSGSGSGSATPSTATSSDHTDHTMQEWKGCEGSASPRTPTPTHVAAVDESQGNLAQCLGSGTAIVSERAVETGPGRMKGHSQGEPRGPRASISAPAAGLRRFLPNTGQPRRKVMYLDSKSPSGQRQQDVTVKNVDGVDAAAKTGMTAAVPAVAAVPGSTGNSARATAEAAPADAAGMTGKPQVKTAETTIESATFGSELAVPESSQGLSAAGMTSDDTKRGPSLCTTTPSEDALSCPESSSESLAPQITKALRSPGRSFTDPWAPWTEPPAGTPKVHVVQVRSDKRPPGSGVPISPENQPYFPEEEEEETDEEENLLGDKFVHDDRDADEMADDLYAGTLAGADEEEEEEEERLERGRGSKEELSDVTGHIRRRTRRQVGSPAGAFPPGAGTASVGVGGDAATGPATGSRARTHGTSSEMVGSWWKRDRKRKQQQSETLMERERTKALLKGAPTATAPCARTAATATVSPISLQLPKAGGPRVGVNAGSGSGSGSDVGLESADGVVGIPADLTEDRLDAFDRIGVGHVTGALSPQRPDQQSQQQRQDLESLALRGASLQQIHSCHDHHHATDCHHHHQHANGPACGATAQATSTAGEGIQEGAAALDTHTLVGVAVTTAGEGVCVESGAGPGPLLTSPSSARAPSPPLLAVGAVTAGDGSAGGSGDRDSGGAPAVAADADAAPASGSYGSATATATATVSGGGSGDCDDNGDGDGVATLEPWMQRDDLDSLSGDESDGAASSASSVDDYNYKSMLPYFHRTTRHYRLVLSPYNEVQTALVSWVNSRTVAFVVGIGLGSLQDPGPALEDGAYAEEGANGVATAPVMQARGVLLQLLAAPVRECCSQLTVRVPQYDVDRKLTALASSFRLSGPVPSFKQPQWMLLSLALLHALSVHHIPALRSSLCMPTSASCSADPVITNSCAATPAGEPLPPPLRAGGVHRPHPRLVSLMERIGFDMHYLFALVDFLTSPEF